MVTYDHRLGDSEHSCSGASSALAYQRWLLTISLTKISMNLQIRTVFLSYFVGIVAGLMGDIVAGYVAPAFENRPWLTFSLFTVSALLGLWFAVVQQAPHLLRQPTQKKFIPSLLQIVQTGYTYRLYFLIWAVLFVLMARVVWVFSPAVSNLWAQNAPHCPPDRVCVLATEIAPQESEIARIITHDITQEIRTVLEKTVASRYTVRTGPAVADAQTAMTRAAQDGNLLVVWGEALESINKLRIQFELVDLLGVGESRTARVYRAEPFLYDPIDQSVECFNCMYVDISANVAQRARIVAYTAAGLVDYVQGQPEQARFAFMAALYCAGEEVDAAVIDLLQPDCPQQAGLSDWNPGLLYYYLGKALVLQGDYKRGIADLEQAATHNPRDPAAWIGIGSAYQSWLAQPDAPVAVAALAEAQTRAEKLLADLPPSEWAPIYYDIGLIRELLGDTTGAQQYYTEAVKRFGKADVSAYVALVSLARVQRVSGALDAAKQSAEQARALDPSSPWVYLELAALAQSEQALAEQMLDDAARYAPNQAYTFITRAELCEKQWQDRACAADAYTQALDRRPNSGWLHSRVGEFYLPTNPVLAGQSWTLTHEHYQEALRLRPNDPWAQERLAYVLYNLGNYADAAQHYARAIDLVYAATENAALYCSLGRAQERGALLDAAKQAYQRCKELATDPQQRARAEALLAGLGK